MSVHLSRSAHDNAGATDSATATVLPAPAQVFNNAAIQQAIAMRRQPRQYYMQRTPVMPPPVPEPDLFTAVSRLGIGVNIGRDAAGIAREVIISITAGAGEHERIVHPIVAKDTDAAIAEVEKILRELLKP